MAEAKAGYEVLPHTADIGVRAWAPDLGGALDRAVAGLAAVMLGRDPGAGTGERPAELQATTREELVVALLDECLYRVDAEGWLPRGARLDRFEGGEARATLLGAPLDPEAEDEGLHVKAITWHQLAVREVPGGVEVVVYLDI